MRCSAFSWIPCGTNVDPVGDINTAVIPTHASSSEANGNPPTSKVSALPHRQGWSWLDVSAESSLKCPMTKLSLQGIDAVAKTGECPFHKHGLDIHTVLDAVDEEGEGMGQVKLEARCDKCPLRHLQLKDGSPYATEETARLLRDIGGGDVVRMFCTRFYTRVFLDKQLDPFFFSGDGAVGHANRLGDWIVELMGGEGTPWFDSGRWGSREAQHVEGWWNTKRSKELQGVPFKLDDCRCWMRLHFWAIRECKLHQHKEFWHWYQQFIAHFIRIYEPTAPPYVPADAEWSADEKNIQLYFQQGNHMLDVVGIGRY